MQHKAVRIVNVQSERKARREWQNWKNTRSSVVNFMLVGAGVRAG
jgi:hypothetical protein